jgi:hypothetical protein
MTGKWTTMLQRLDTLMKTPTIVAVLFFSVFTVVADPPKTEAEAGVIVTNLVRKMGVKLESYEQPKVSHSRKTGEWRFFYTLKPPGMPGGHFTVIVDAEGKATHRGGK